MKTPLIVASFCENAEEKGRNVLLSFNTAIIKILFFAFLGLFYFVEIKAQNELFFYFGQNETLIQQTESAKIDSICQVLNRVENKRYALTLAGFASTEGQEKANKKLSVERAFWIKESLIRCAAPKIERFILESQGATTQFSAGNTEENYKRNRCVRVKWEEIALPKIVVPDSASKFSILSKDTLPSKSSTLRPIQELYSEIALPFQPFFIATKRDTFLIGEKGTLIFIAQNTFSGCDTVNIRLKEAFKKSEMIRENLTTLTLENQILQTFGMIYWEANCKGISIMPQKPIEILIPTDKALKMPIFDGTRTDSSSFYWKPTGTAETTTLPDYVSGRIGKLHDGGEMQNCGCPENMKEKLVYTFTQAQKLPRNFYSEGKKPCGKWVILKGKKRMEKTCETIKKANFRRNHKEALEKIENSLKTGNLSAALYKNRAAFYYLIKPSAAGWTNFDVYVNRKKGKIHLQAKPNPNRVFQVIYDDIAIILPLLPQTKSYQSEGILEMPATLIEMKKEAENVYILGKQSVKTAENMRIKENEIQYRSFSTAADFIKALQELDK